MAATKFTSMFKGKELAGKRAAFVTANEGVEQIELTGPWDALGSAGAERELIAPSDGKVQAFEHLDKGDTFAVDRTTAQASPKDYDLLVLPGGVANPDQLRTDDAAVEFVRAFAASGKPIAAICHAPWTLVEAGVVDGKRLTSWPSLKTDIENAGGEWVDENVVIDGSLVTSRKPADLEAFCKAVVELASA